MSNRRTRNKSQKAADTAYKIERYLCDNSNDVGYNVIKKAMIDKDNVGATDNNCVVSGNDRATNLLDGQRQNFINDERIPPLNHKYNNTEGEEQSHDKILSSDNSNNINDDDNNNNNSGNIDSNDNKKKGININLGESDEHVTSNSDDIIMDDNVFVDIDSDGNATNGSDNNDINDLYETMMEYSHIFPVNSEKTAENSVITPEMDDDLCANEACIVSIDSLKYGDYKLNNDEHIIRITQKDICIDAVTFHNYSIQIDFHCLSPTNPLLEKYGVNLNTSFIWHAELAGEIIPEECEMRHGNREFMVKKRDPSQWTSGLLHSHSSNVLSSLSSYQPTTRPYSSRFTGSYRYSGLSSYNSFSSNANDSSSLTNRPTSYSRSMYVSSSHVSYSPLYHVSNSTSTQKTTPSQSSANLQSSSANSLPRRWASSSSVLSPPSSSSSSFISTNDVPASTTVTSTRSLFGRPTAMVSPYEERGIVTEPGFTGLRNIGNTCFMNATLQMLVNCKELQVYFLGNHYKKDINSINPLGFGGRLAEAFAEFMKKVWSCMHRMTEPAAIKELVAEKASQFANFAQHDAHEFMSFLIDGLHEDLNRIRSKPNTNTIEPRGRPDYEVSKEAWSNYLMRNDSIFVDLFHGQLKSRLQCPRCNQISITFDPFVYLAVPFPKEKRSLWIYFWPLDPFLKPVKLNIRVSADANVSEVLSSVSHLVNVLTKSLRMIEVSNHRISKIFRADDSASQILPTDVIYVFQVHDPLDCNEEVVELFVIQRLLYHKSIVRACANCHTTETSLKVCDGCYDSFYCKRECQRQHWISEHKDRCKLRSHVEYVGEPFIISLPKSKVTYANIIRNLESRCRYSVNVFQPPIETKDPPDSPSSSAIASSETCSTLSSTVNGVRHPMVQKSARPIGVKRQMVLGEPRNKQFYDSHLFLVRKLQSAENVLGPIIAATDDELTIQSSTVLSINWMNMKNGKDYLTVESKEEVDVDEDKTAYYQRISATSTNRNASTSNPSLYDMLSMFSETERLKPEESWYCNKCKEHVEATKQLMLYRLPPILIIQLKRFVYTTSLMTFQRRTKDERTVNYPIEDLDLSNFLCETADQNQETLYDLTGVVCHSGSSYFGHYVSMGRLQSLDGKMTEIDWRLFDDSVVTRIQPSRVQSADAYLLFYKQRGSNTERVLKRNYNLDLVNVPSSSHSN